MKYFQLSKKSSEKAKQKFEKEIADLKSKASSNNEFPSKKLQELQEKNSELEENYNKEAKKVSTLTAQYELLEEEFVLFKAKLTTEKEKLENEIKTLKARIKDDDTVYKQEKEDLSKRIKDLQKKLTEAEHNSGKISSASNDLEKKRLQSKLEEKETEYENLKKQHEMVVDQLSQLRKDFEDSRRKLDDFERVNKAQRTLNEHNATLENELKKLRMK